MRQLSANQLGRRLVTQYIAVPGGRALMEETVRRHCQLGGVSGVENSVKRRRCG